MLTHGKRFGLLALVWLASCAGTTSPAPAKPLDLTKYSKIVVPAVTTTVQGEKRAESEHFAAVLRGALTREIDGGGKMKPLAYPGSDLTGTARLVVDVESLERDGNGIYPVVRFSVVDARTNAVIRSSAVADGVGAEERREGPNSLTWTAEFWAQAICGELGIGATPPQGSE